jgi:hypothetical protein
MAGSYARRASLEKVASRVAVPDGRVLISQDPTMHAPQPAVFVLGSCKRFSRDAAGHFVPKRPWAQVRFFRAGQEITSAEARQLAQDDPTAAAPFDTLVWQDR